MNEGDEIWKMKNSCYENEANYERSLFFIKTTTATTKQTGLKRTEIDNK